MSKQKEIEIETEIGLINRNIKRLKDHKTIATETEIRENIGRLEIRRSNLKHELIALTNSNTLVVDLDKAKPKPNINFNFDIITPEL